MCPFGWAILTIKVYCWENRIVDNRQSSKAKIVCAFHSSVQLLFKFTGLNCCIFHFSTFDTIIIVIIHHICIWILNTEFICGTMFGALSLACRLFIFANFYINLINIKRPCQQMKQPSEMKFIYHKFSLHSLHSLHSLLGSWVFGSWVFSLLFCVCTLCTKHNIIPLALAYYNSVQWK